MDTPDLRPADIGFAPREAIAALSGLDFLRAMLDGGIPHPPMAATGNYRIAEVSDGRVVFEGAPTPAHLNPQRTTHGGWFGTILDTALGCAVMTRLPAGKGYTTLEYKVNLLRGLAPGTRVRAIGTSRHAGRRTGVAEAELIGAADGKLYATASTTCFILDLLPDQTG